MLFQGTSEDVLTGSYLKSSLFRLAKLPYGLPYENIMKGNELSANSNMKIIRPTLELINSYI